VLCEQQQMRDSFQILPEDIDWAGFESEASGGRWCRYFEFYFQAVLVSDVRVDGGCAWRLAVTSLEFGFPLKAVTETLSPPSEPVCAHVCLWSASV